MDLTNGLLIIVIVILLYVVVRKQNGKTAHGGANGDANGVVNGGSSNGNGDNASAPENGRTENGQIAPPGASNSPENGLARENAEYYVSCGSDPEKLPSCGNVEYAIYDFGAPGRDFKDYITNFAIEPAVKANHAEFVKDRIARNDQTITGPTWSPAYRMPEFEGVSDVPWVGLRRGQKVKVCNPTQVAEFNPNLYTDAPTFVWTSTPYY